MYVCTHMYIYIYIYAHIHIYVYKYHIMCTHICIYNVHTNLYIVYIYSNMCIYMYMYIDKIIMCVLCMYMYVYVCMYVYVYVCGNSSNTYDIPRINSFWVRHAHLQSRQDSGESSNSSR